VVQHVGAVLGRGHALFGDPPESGGSAAAGAESQLIGAADGVRTGQGQIAGLSGRFATAHGAFAAGAGSGLDALAGTDQGLSGQLDEAAGSDRTGGSASGAIVSGAAADTAALAPFSHMPVGESVLLMALRARVAQQQRVVAVYKTRDARMAALLRSMAYAGRARGGRGWLGMPSGGGGLGGALPTGFGGAPWSPSGLSGLARPSSPRAAAVRGFDRRAGAVPPRPGGVAVRAALSKRGVPYVWGAKGPDQFDCSGLTQWAWRQAGVQLGGDTYTQINQGIPVPPGDVRAGDLIFPKDAFDGRGPGHVQLAISPTEVIHAPQAGDVVRIAPMPSAYVARRPVPLD
jgi:peptidoglycan DL-endopeptidase CwlO